VVELALLADLPTDQRPSVIVLAIAGMPVTAADVATHGGNHTAAQLAAVTELAGIAFFADVSTALSPS